MIEAGALAATAWVALVWSLTTLVLVGFGRHVMGALGAWRATLEGAFLAFWSGWIALIAFLQLWHLVLPVSTVTVIVVAALGVTGLARGRAELPRAVIRRVLAGGAKGVLGLALGVAIALWLANVAAGPCQYGDTGMYHLPMARWLVAEPIVPGLANLHGRFGFNNASLLFAALFETPGFEGRSHHLAQGPPVVVFLAGALASLARWLGGSRSVGGARAWGDLFLGLLVAPSLYMALGRPFTSLSTDLPSALCLFVAAWRLVVWLVPAEAEDGRDGEDDPGRPATARFDELFVVAGFTTAAVVKVTAAPMAALASLVVLVAGRRRRAERGQGRGLVALGPMLPGLLVLLVLAGPWAVRGLILSGYPLYPSALVSAPVDWRVPAEQVEGERAWALASCRMAKLAGPDGDWLPAWIEKRKGSPLSGVPATVSAVAVALGLASLFARRERLRVTRRRDFVLPVVLVAWFAALAWFRLSPNPRFGFGILWVAVASAVLWCAAGLGLGPYPSRLLRVAGFVFVAVTSAHVVVFLMGEEKLDWRERWLVEEAGSDGGLHPYKVTATEIFVSDSGLELAVPEQSNNLWMGPVLGTPYPAPNLALRREGERGSGFRVEGPWQPERWPKEGSSFRAEMRRSP